MKQSLRRYIGTALLSFLKAPFGKGEVLSKSMIWDTTPKQRKSCQRQLTEGLY